MRRARKRTRRARIGVELILLALAAAGGLGGGQRTSEAYALVAGTVFRETGLALAGAEVTLAPTKPPENAKKKVRAMRAMADSRGEFAFRVPPGQSVYTVTVDAKGYRKTEKEVTVTGEERVDVFIEMTPASK